MQMAVIKNKWQLWQWLQVRNGQVKSRSGSRWRVGVWGCLTRGQQCVINIKRSFWETAVKLVSLGQGELLRLVKDVLLQDDRRETRKSTAVGGWRFSFCFFGWILFDLLCFLLWNFIFDFWWWRRFIYGFFGTLSFLLSSTTLGSMMAKVLWMSITGTTLFTTESRSSVRVTLMSSKTVFPCVHFRAAWKVAGKGRWRLFVWIISITFNTVNCLLVNAKTVRSTVLLPAGATAEINLRVTGGKVLSKKAEFFGHIGTVGWEGTAVRFGLMSLEVST